MKVKSQEDQLFWSLKFSDIMWKPAVRFKRSCFAPEPFENVLQSGAIWKRCFWKRCFLVWTVKTTLSENGDVIKTTRPWVSKMADRRYHVASISRQFRGPICWNAHVSSSFDHAHWGYKSVFKQIRRCSVDDSRIRSKTAPFSFENGLVWTGPKKTTTVTATATATRQKF